LTLGTTYYVKVIEYLRCGAGPYDYYYNTSSGTNATTFTTTGATAVPWSEGFATTTLPTNWVNTGFTLGTGGTGGNPGNGIYKNIWSSATTGNFVSPVLGALPSNYRLTFDYRLGNYSDINVSPGTGSGNFVVAISTNGGTTYSDILTVANNAITGWQPVSIDLNSYAGQNIRLRFTATIVGTAPDYYIGFDNFSIDATPSCFIPTALTASSVTPTSATVSWTAPSAGTTPVEYEYAVTTSLTAPASGTTNASTSASVTGLSANTTYFIHVRSVCTVGSEYSAWTSGGSFTTPAVTSAPWTEGFATTTLPSGWSNSGMSIGSVANFAPTTNAIYQNLYSSSTTGNFSTINVGLITAGLNLSFDYRLVDWGTGVTTIPLLDPVILWFKFLQIMEQHILH